MKWLQTAWPLLRDIGIAGTGLAAIWLQLILWAVLQRVPNDALLASAGSLLVPSAVAHVRILLRTAGSSSDSLPPPSLPSSSPPLPEAGTGEH